MSLVQKANSFLKNLFPLKTDLYLYTFQPYLKGKNAERDRRRWRKNCGRPHDILKKHYRHYFIVHELNKSGNSHYHVLCPSSSATHRKFSKFCSKLKFCFHSIKLVKKSRRPTYRRINLKKYFHMNPLECLNKYDSEFEDLLRWTHQHIENQKLERNRQLLRTFNENNPSLQDSPYYQSMIDVMLYMLKDQSEKANQYTDYLIK